ncbi:5-hydroxytryptamine receptor 2A, partial [Fragariocoptes setiger]
LALALVIISTIVGNVFVIAAIVWDKNLRTTGNQLVMSLAVADLMVACLVMPLGAYNELYQGWYLSTEACEFWTSADVLCCTASILNLLAIAIDRYWAVTSVDYCRRRRTRKRVSLMIVCAWTVAAIVSLAPIFGWKDVEFSERVLVEHKCLVSQDILYQLFATISTFYAPLTLLLILYWKIYQVARKRIRNKPGLNSSSLAHRKSSKQQNEISFVKQGDNQTINHDSRELDVAAVHQNISQRQVVKQNKTNTNNDDQLQQQNQSKQTINENSNKSQLQEMNPGFNKSPTTTTMITRRRKCYCQCQQQPHQLPYVVSDCDNGSSSNNHKQSIATTTTTSMTATAQRYIDRQRCTQRVDHYFREPSDESSLTSWKKTASSRQQQREHCTHRNYGQNNNNEVIDSIERHIINSYESHGIHWSPSVPSISSMSSSMSSMSALSESVSSLSAIESDRHTSSSCSSSLLCASKLLRLSSQQPLNGFNNGERKNDIDSVSVSLAPDSEWSEREDEETSSSLSGPFPPPMSERIRRQLAEQMGETVVTPTMNEQHLSSSLSSTLRPFAHTKKREACNLLSAGEVFILEAIMLPTITDTKTKIETPTTSKLRSDESNIDNYSNTIDYINTIDNDNGTPPVIVVDHNSSKQLAANSRRENGWWQQLTAVLYGIKYFNSKSQVCDNFNSKQAAAAAAIVEVSASEEGATETTSKKKSRHNITTTTTATTTNITMAPSLITQPCALTMHTTNNNCISSSNSDNNLNLNNLTVVSSNNVAHRRFSHQRQRELDVDCCRGECKVDMSTHLAPATTNHCQVDALQQRHSSQSLQLQVPPVQGLLNHASSSSSNLALNASLARQNTEQRRERKAAKTLAIITGVFVGCWLPFFVNAVMMPACGLPCTPSDLVLSILLWLGYVNSMLNPIIYTIFSPDFRRAFRCLLCLPMASHNGKQKQFHHSATPRSH